MGGGTRIVEVEGLRLAYGTKEVLHGISFGIDRNEIFAVIGPAQSGKTSLLRCLNRTTDFIPGATVSGAIRVDGDDIRRVSDVFGLRRRVGMVAPLPVGLPMSIYDNVAFAPRCSGMTAKRELDDIVERCLTQAALWHEVKDRLSSLGTALSGGQQQRLTIARALSHVQQARRLADRTMFLWNGEIVELGPSEIVFSDHPGDRRTYDYVNGIFG
jgi:phosphate transport system ATP-binding protein